MLYFSSHKIKMFLRAILFLQPAVWAFPQSGDNLIRLTDDPNFLLVIEAMINPISSLCFPNSPRATLRTGSPKPNKKYVPRSNEQETQCNNRLSRVGRCEHLSVSKLSLTEVSRNANSSVTVIGLSAMDSPIIHQQRIALSVSLRMPRHTSSIIGYRGLRLFRSSQGFTMRERFLPPP